MKAFLGMGLLGSNFVKALLSKGEQVQIWNRTAAKAEALAALGAIVAATPADAVRNADIIHLTLKDDETVNEVLQQAEAGLKSGAVIIDHTTTSAEGAVERTATWKQKGFTYLHAPVFMGPQNALESTGFMLVSGDQQAIATVEAELSKMTGKLMNVGDAEGKAAGLKLVGNLFLISLTGGLIDALSLAKAQNISPDEVLNLFANWNPANMIPARVKRITSGDYSQPSWELNMARKDAGLMLKAATDLMVIPAVVAVMDKWISEGYGSSDWTVISRESL
ncbi:NAD(P)-dependent oxidoreductase [Mucilaginibacter sp. RS28]|uniref:NAD(P)-dependent oxidoreductase n=1 Tax=Mucilaginibacter straminoryzae TaxID=2932774 RepID=A0A9X1X381_9SPHI|nr:NAD(P)-dependent oxidoreductase [Mucilaginibacter straminoryzae]MCJ8209811.1 NAD(P)-dependent oxidoreductase [Mucilaginibacter straminoryzae]